MCKDYRIVLCDMSNSKKMVGKHLIKIKRDTIMMLYERASITRKSRQDCPDKAICDRRPGCGRAAE